MRPGRSRIAGGVFKQINSNMRDSLLSMWKSFGRRFSQRNVANKASEMNEGGPTQSGVERGKNLDLMAR